MHTFAYIFQNGYQIIYLVLARNFFFNSFWVDQNAFSNDLMNLFILGQSKVLVHIFVVFFLLA